MFFLPRMALRCTVTQVKNTARFTAWPSSAVSECESLTLMSTAVSLSSHYSQRKGVQSTWCLRARNLKNFTTTGNSKSCPAFFNWAFIDICLLTVLKTRITADFQDVLQSAEHVVKLSYDVRPKHVGFFCVLCMRYLPLHNGKKRKCLQAFSLTQL